MIYLIMFGVSSVLFYLGMKSRNSISRKLFFFSAILAPSILAGCRDYSIGTDVLVYGNPWFEIATKAKGFEWYVDYATNSDIGALYAVMNYVVARFTQDPHWFYFVLSFLSTLFVFLAVYEYREDINVPFAMFVYYCFFYNQSLNLLRQTMALVVLLWGIKFIRNQQWIRYGIIVVIAMQFHVTAIMGVVMPVIYIISNSKLKKIWNCLLIVGCLVVMAGFPTILNLLIQKGILSSRFSFYILEQQRGGGIARVFLFCIPILIQLFLCNKYRIEKTAEWNFLSLCTIILALMSLLAFRMTYIIRQAYYFDMYMVIFIPMMARKLKITDRSLSQKYYINYTYVINVLYLITYWVIIYAVRGSGETYPYKFMV